jgi:hypothetical protein
MRGQEEAMSIVEEENDKSKVPLEDGIHTHNT